MAIDVFVGIVFVWYGKDVERYATSGIITIPQKEEEARMMILVCF